MSPRKAGKEDVAAAKRAVKDAKAAAKAADKEARAAAKRARKSKRAAARPGRQGGRYVPIEKRLKNQQRERAAGEAAAEQDFKSEADGLRAERDELAKKLASVSDDIEAAKAEAAASADRLSRLQADWENYRRRTERDRVTERERACEGLVKDLLPAIDDLERAIAHAQASAEGNDVAQQLADGVSAVHEKVVSVLEKQGVEVIDPAGQPFDPMDHQAVGRVENPDEYDETVADVYQKGYRMGGKVVRPAMVTVTYGGAKRAAEPAEGDADAGEAESK